MKFILTSAWDDGIADLTERLARELAGGKRVLWLTSGGSNIPACVEIMDNVSTSLSKNLSVTLADERYGDIGHQDSNWTQLLKTGFDPKNAKTYPILSGDSFEHTRDRYIELINQLYTENDLIIAQLGVGTDGHIAGVLPNSEATRQVSAPVTAFVAPPFKRLTLNFLGLKSISAAYVFAFGDSKKEALNSLRRQSIDPAKQPAQFLKKIPEAYIYNDQIGEVSDGR